MKDTQVGEQHNALLLTLVQDTFQMYAMAETLVPSAPMQ